MRALATLLMAAAVLSSCAAQHQRVLSYNAGWPDADVHVGAYRYQIWFHERDSTVLIQQGAPLPLGQLIAQNVTLPADAAPRPEPYWRAAADAALNQIGCRASEIRGEGPMREAGYVCAPAVDVGAELAQRRAAWRSGIRAAEPPAPP